jgi:hypothetical protein
MTIKIDKKIFLDSFLIPISKLTDNVTIDFKVKEISTIVSSADNSVVLICNAPCDIEGDPIKCIIPDCKSFVRLVNTIEENEPVFVITDNKIVYKHKLISFKYHLLDEVYSISKKGLNENKLKSVEYDTEFTISKKQFSELLRLNTIIPDSEKMYFHTEDSSVFCRLADDQKANINEVRIEVSNKFTGKPLPESTFVINSQSLILTTFTNEHIKANVNHELKIFKFQTQFTCYMIFGLVK